MARRHWKPATVATAAAAAAGAGVAAVAAGYYYYYCRWPPSSRGFGVRSHVEARLLHLALPSVSATDKVPPSGKDRDCVAFTATTTSITITHTHIQTHNWCRFPSCLPPSPTTRPGLCDGDSAYRKSPSHHVSVTQLAFDVWRALYDSIVVTRSCPRSSVLKKKANMTPYCPLCCYHHTGCWLDLLTFRSCRRGCALSHFHPAYVHCVAFALCIECNVKSDLTQCSMCCCLVCCLCEQ